MIEWFFEAQFENFPNFSAVFYSIGAFLFAIVLAPLGVIFLSPLLLPAFAIAVGTGLVFCRYGIRHRLLAAAVGLMGGVVTLPLGDLLLNGQVDLASYGSWHSGLDMVVRLACAGAAGGWFAYTAWFPKQDELSARGAT